MANLPTSPVPFVKMNGSGNDFVVIDNRKEIVAPDAVADFARMTCRRGLGEGADGVVLIDNPPPGSDVDFSWRYVNADGSDGDLCGNGAMCGARFAVDIGLAPAHCRFTTPAGVVTAEVVDSGPAVRLAMVDTPILQRGLALDDGADLTAFDLTRVGVPHVVAVTPDADSLPDFDARGRAIRHDPALAPDGANVDIIHRIANDTIRMRTWERGVEAETLACGTGAVASAIIAASRHLVTQPVRVVTSSGRPLIVTWTQDGDTARDIHLTGDARFVARGTLDPEGFS